MFGMADGDLGIVLDAPLPRENKVGSGGAVIKLQ